VLALLKPRSLAEIQNFFYHYRSHELVPSPIGADTACFALDLPASPPQLAVYQPSRDCATRQRSKPGKTAMLGKSPVLHITFVAHSYEPRSRRVIRVALLITSRAPVVALIVAVEAANSVPCKIALGPNAASVSLEFAKDDDTTARS